MYLKILIDVYIQSADLAQQAFSYDSTPTLHTGLPALKALHKSWKMKAGALKYSPFVDALEAVLMKVEEYYDKTSISHAYTFVMCILTSSACPVIYY